MDQNSVWMEAELRNACEHSAKISQERNGDSIVSLDSENSTIPNLIHQHSSLVCTDTGRRCVRPTWAFWLSRAVRAESGDGTEDCHSGLCIPCVYCSAYFQFWHGSEMVQSSPRWGGEKPNTLRSTPLKGRVECVHQSQHRSSFILFIIYIKLYAVKFIHFTRTLMVNMMRLITVWNCIPAINISA